MEKNVYSMHKVPEEYLKKWQKTVNLMARLFDVPAGLIMRVLPEGIEVLVSSDSAGNPYQTKEKAPLNTGLYCETVMAHRTELHVPNALEDPDWKDNPDVELNMISYLGVPLLWPDGDVFGTICVLDEKTRHYDENYHQLLMEFRQIIERDFALLKRTDELQATLTELQIAQNELQSAYTRLQRDLDAAAQVQKALLPSQTPQNEQVHCAWAYRPCDAIGGDALNILSFGEGQLGLYVLDVVGHGVPAALLSVTLARFLAPHTNYAVMGDHESVQTEIVDPASLMSQLNERFDMESNGGRFFTMLYGVLDSQKGLFRYVAAGHPGPILLRPGEPPRVINVPGYPVGVMPKADYISNIIELCPGDRLFLRSDGLNEQPNGVGELFGDSGICRAIARTRDLPLQGSVQEVIQAVVDWGGSEHLQDDVALLAVELH